MSQGEGGFDDLSEHESEEGSDIGDYAQDQSEIEKAVEIGSSYPEEIAGLEGKKITPPYTGFTADMPSSAPVTNQTSPIKASPSDQRKTPSPVPFMKKSASSPGNVNKEENPSLARSMSSGSIKREGKPVVEAVKGENNPSPKISDQMKSPSFRAGDRRKPPSPKPVKEEGIPQGAYAEKGSNSPIKLPNPPTRFSRKDLGEGTNVVLRKIKEYKSTSEYLNDILLDLDGIKGEDNKWTSSDGSFTATTTSCEMSFRLPIKDWRFLASFLEN